MKRWHLNHEYPNYFVNQLLDPDFDDLGGELTLAQIRDPVLTWAETWKPPVSPMGGDPLAYVARQQAQIKHQHQQLNYWARRFKHAFKLYIPHKQQQLQDLDVRLQVASNFETQVARKRDWLQALSQQFLMAQTNTYPKFNFKRELIQYRQKCNRCVPYNGHFTINYWATGQKDCW